MLGGGGGLTSSGVKTRVSIAILNVTINTSLQNDMHVPSVCVATSGFPLNSTSEASIRPVA